MREFDNPAPSHMDFTLAGAYSAARSLRLADGPDEVHVGVVAGAELAKYSEVTV